MGVSIPSVWTTWALGAVVPGKLTYALKRGGKMHCIASVKSDALFCRSCLQLRRLGCSFPSCVITCSDDVSIDELTDLSLLQAFMLCALQAYSYSMSELNNMSVVMRHWPGYS